MQSAITFLIITTWLISFSIAADPRTSEAGLLCGVRQAPNPNYIPLFVRGMEQISQRVTANGWGHSSVNETRNGTRIDIYALAHCYQDLPLQDCLSCYAFSRTRLPRCLPAVSARIYLDGCFLRYDSYDFFNESVDPVKDSFNCSSATGAASNQELPNFENAVRQLVDNVTAAATVEGHYAVRGLNGVYGLAQCWRTLSREGCRQCLAKASRQVKGCVPNREGRALNAGCYLRYSTVNFYGNSTRSSVTSRTGRTVAIASAVATFCMLSLFAAYAIYRRIKKTKRERKNLGQILSLYNKSSLNFKYETLEKATDYFDESRKLGQGGAGSVYKGTLPNGKTIAVKRLFFSTRQWVDEFFNEVNLISGIEHKNLVKLLGCSIEGPESLLVYELVSNGSLEQNLFDKNKSKLMNWKKRFDIMVGTAEGLAFLHGGAEIRIIHRDIKTSNVILDENYLPKIADFGLARHFAADKSHLSTGIAGTLGYMAPEYLIKGQLTEKADVYSFGVLVLEMVCGRKNCAFGEDTGSLLQTVWRLYKTDKLTEYVDPCMNEDFPPKEADKVLRIGLLCTQASPLLRPSMDEVVEMFVSPEYQIPEPKQPPFVNVTLLSASTTGSYSVNSLVTNPMNKPEASSYTSTESSSMQSSDAPVKSREFKE